MTDFGGQPAAGFTRIVDVAVALPVYTAYTYGVPPDLSEVVAVGSRVLVPFRSRLISGYVVAFRTGAQPESELKAVADVLGGAPFFPETMVPFFRWVADYYIHPLGAVIQGALPGGLTIAEQTRYHLTDRGRAARLEAGQRPVDKEGLTCLTQGPLTYKQLQKTVGSSMTRAVLKRWLSSGWAAGQTALMGGRTRPRMVRCITPLAADQDLSALSPQRREILKILVRRGTLPLKDLKQKIPTAAGLVRSMARDGQVRLEEQRLYRDPFGETIAPDQPPELMPQQQQAVEKMRADLGRGYQTYVLAGVTGSGKTEVYLHMAAAALKSNLQVLVLVPEIALVSQIERSFRARFGECVALLHSGLSPGERLDQWRRIIQGDASVAVGARSAIFAPFDHLGLVIVDEEHDDSYKQEGALRYNARDLAVVRGRQHGAVVILGSATPSLQSVYNTQIGKFKPVYLSERVDHRVLPDVHVHDLTQQNEERGLRRFLTPALLEAAKETLARGEQVLLFLNRRGFSSSLVCAHCGRPLRCDRCDISMTYHQGANAYQCHYCGFSRAAVSTCPNCGSSKIKRLGMGTEKLADGIQQFFPAARVARMDRDTVSRKGAMLKILKSLRDRKIDILVGTQMVAKGHDYPYITLVGIICADLSLSLPDFRAGERTFQLLAQVAGRAGRGQRCGQVILQTFNPDHFSVQAARNQDYAEFYRQEIEFRKALQYPPFTRLIQVRIHGRDKDKVAQVAGRLGQLSRDLKKDEKGFAAVQVMGPLEAPLAKIANQYRWQLLLKCPHINPLHRFARHLLFADGARIKRGDVSISLDVDPVFLM
jgi:primosomal protein N' (replication factor Y) (superfamily II helicase)